MKFLYLLFILNLRNSEAALRIIGGRDALRGEFPFVVRLERKEENQRENRTIFNDEYRHLCSGAALTSEWILSAAHCYDKTLKIFARFNSYFPKEKGKLSPILDVHIHPHFVEHRIIGHNDIGLFRSKDVLVSRYAKISAVDYTALYGHGVYILGFGTNNGSDNTKTLLVFRAMINKCISSEISDLKMFYEYSPVCVVASCRVEATICGGDSGGPVVHPSGIVGVNSMSNNYCDEFTRLKPGTSADMISLVSPALDWIARIISTKITP